MVLRMTSAMKLPVLLQIESCAILSHREDGLQSLLQRDTSLTRLTRGARPALADFQRTSHAYTRANEPTAHAGRSQYNATAVGATRRTPPRRWSYTRIIQPEVATNGAATVNRTKVSTSSLEFDALAHQSASLPASSTPGKSIWDRRRRPEQCAKLVRPL